MEHAPVITPPGEVEAPLRSVRARAQRLARRLGHPVVAPRELLLALSAAHPALVVAAAAARGVNPRRLAWALSEWCPSAAAGGPAGSDPTLSAAALQLLAGAAQRAATAGTAPEGALAEELFALSAADSPDPTAAALRALALA